MRPITQFVWDSRNCAASADLIEQHFCQIRGMDSAQCAYLMRISSTLSGLSIEHTELFDNQMIERYPIIKPTELLANFSAPDVEPPL